MIISHKHRYIFFAVPRTATHSVRQALHHYSDGDDWEQQALFGSQTIPIPEITEIGHGHISVRQIGPILKSRQLEGYFRFGFVRNPYDRFVSSCAFLNRQNPDFKAEPLAWMKMAMARPAFRARILVSPQSHLLTFKRGEVGVNFVGRYEALQSSMDKIFKRLDLPKVELQVRNSSNHAAYRAYYDADLRKLVEAFYHVDLQLFDYTF